MAKITRRGEDKRNEGKHRNTCWHVDCHVYSLCVSSSASFVVYFFGGSLSTFDRHETVSAKSIRQVDFLTCHLRHRHH